MILESSMKLGLLLCYLNLIASFRIHDPTSNVTITPLSFVPYQTGFVGVNFDPQNPYHTPGNPGNPLGVTHPNLFEEENPRQPCPSMVGPFEGVYYCRDIQYGYCDRRSGRCVCSTPYQGIDCSECKPSHYEASVNNVFTCLPKKLCPNSCSGGGTCDYSTGLCSCVPYRMGNDCSEFFCMVHFDPLCDECTNSTCTKCVEGYHVTADGQHCGSCTDYDPRCGICDANQCLSCTDVILKSIRRSGRRRVDHTQPIEEDARELSLNLPFGTKRPEAFSEAEPFYLTGRNVSLSATAVDCTQGLQKSDSWTCVPHNPPLTHTVCGHPGTFSFASPTYAAPEAMVWLPITVRRSGGGMGAVSVEYALTHKETDTTNVTPTASYTTVQTLQFEDGVIQKTFYLTIHEDNIYLPDNTFTLTLRNPMGGAVIGPQGVTVVTIIDGDLHSTQPLKTTPINLDLNVEYVANTPIYFGIQTFNWQTPPAQKTSGGDMYYVAIYDVGVSPGNRLFLNSGSCLDYNNGYYECGVTPPYVGKFELSVQFCNVNGLLGEYYDNAWFLGNPVISRIDTEVNFQWGLGRLTVYGNDLVTIRWTGKVLPPSGGGIVNFILAADDHCRLWIDGVLLIDHWNSPCEVQQCFAPTTNGILSDIIIEYRELYGSANIELSWVINGTTSIIPKTNLFSSRHIGDTTKSPFVVSPYSINVVPALLNPNYTIAFGTDLVSTVAGRDSSFIIIPKDTVNNLRGSYGSTDLFDVTLDLQSSMYADSKVIGYSEVYGTLTYDSVANVWNVDYNTPIAGVYTMAVSNIGGYVTDPSRPLYPIFGSPFILNVTPDHTSAAFCDIVGTGLVGGIVGNSFPFAITARDRNKNFRKVGGDFWNVVAYNANGVDSYLGTFTDNGDGTYSGSYIVQTDGAYNLYISLGGEQIAGSPFVITTTYNNPYGPTSVASGNSLAASTSSVPISFTLVVKDIFNNIRKNNDDTSAIVFAISGSSISTSILSLGNGVYTCTYTPFASGLQSLTIQINNNGLMTNVRGSPFAVQVLDGATAASTSIASGLGLISGTAGVLTSFTIHARDVAGNPRTYPSTDSWSVTFSGGNISIPATWVSGSTNGDWIVTILPLLSGTKSIIVKYNNSPIIGSPFSPLISPNVGTWATSVITGSGLTSGVAGVVAPVTIQSVDAYGNNVLISGDEFHLKSSVASSNDPRALLVVQGNYLSAGKYDLSYTPLISGATVLNVYHWHQGGLYASYFSTEEIMLSASSTPIHGIQRIDSQISFDWGTKPVSSGLPSQKWSVQWSGALEAINNEEYTFTVQGTGSGARLSINSIIVFDTWTSTVLSKSTSGNIRLQSNTRYAFTFQWKHDVGSAAVALLWSSPSAPIPTIIPSSAFWREYVVVNSPFSTLIAPAPTSSALSYATGLGIVSATVNHIQTFIIIAKDAFGNLRGVGGSSWTVILYGPILFPINNDNLRSKILGNVVDNGDGTYTVSYTPIDAGRHTLYVTLGLSNSTDLGVHMVDASILSLHISGSPFVVHVSDDITSVLTTVATGQGLFYAMAGVQATFIIHAKDIDGNPRSVAADNFVVNILDDAGRILTVCKVTPWTDPSSIASMGDYVVTYEAFVAGHNRVSITLNNLNIVNSPFDLVVVPNVPSPIFSTFNSTVLSPASGLQTTFYITARDAYNNLRKFNQDTFAVVVSGPEIIHPSATNTQDSTGTYMVSFTPTFASLYEIDVALALAGSNGLDGFYYSNLEFKGDPLKSQIDSSINMKWIDNFIVPVADEGASVRWSGFIQPTYAQEYTFTVISNDGVRLYINNQLLIDTIDNDDDVLVTQSSVSIILSNAGALYSIKIEMVQFQNEIVGIGNAKIQLFWQSYSTAYSIVPSSALFAASKVVPIQGSPHLVTTH